MRRRFSLAVIHAADMSEEYHVPQERHGSADSSQAGGALCCGRMRGEAEPELRYFLAGRTIGLPNPRLYGRTLLGITFWLCVPALLASFFGRRNARSALHRVERRWARRAAQYLDIRLDIEGLEHVDPHTQYVVTPLHEGFADVIALLHLPLDLRFAARDELFT